MVKLPYAEKDVNNNLLSIFQVKLLEIRGSYGTKSVYKFLKKFL